MAEEQQPKHKEHGESPHDAKEHGEQPPGKKHAEDSHGEKEHGGGGGDPMHHILDQVLIGINAKTGQITLGSRAYDAHGHTLASYEPSRVGPFKLEFTKHMLSLTLVAAIVFSLGMVTARAVLAGIRDNSAPKGRLANAVEAIILFVRDELVVPIGGHHLGHYTPLFLTYFVFILTANLFGMIPDAFGLWGAATGNIAVTIAMGGSIYALVWILGAKEQGLAKYILHLVPPGTPWWLWPLMFVLEIMGPLIKCFVLCVRLFANMIAGHLIVSTVLGLGAIGGLMPPAIAGVMLLFGVPLALGISILDVLVCCIQAYVFTLLAIIFIGGAVHPEH